MSVILIIGFTALVLYFLAETAFERLFGYFGASVVWLVSFGRIRMNPLNRDEAELANWVGIIATIVVVVSICYTM